MQNFKIENRFLCVHIIALVLDKGIEFLPQTLNFKSLYINNPMV